MNISILPEICNTGFQPVPQATGWFADNEFQARWQRQGQADCCTAWKAISLTLWTPLRYH